MVSGFEHGARGTFGVRSLPIVEPPIPEEGGRLLGDTAGEMARIFNGPAMRFLAYIEFALGGRPRGNHVHHVKVEHLYVISGALESTFVNSLTGDTATRLVTAGDLVTVQPECAHVYQAREATHALEFSTSVYDPEDVERYPIV